MIEINTLDPNQPQQFMTQLDGSHAPMAFGWKHACFYNCDRRKKTTKDSIKSFNILIGPSFQNKVWTPKTSKNGYPPVIKHGNGKSIIYQMLLAINLHSLRGFSSHLWWHQRRWSKVQGSQGLRRWPTPSAPEMSVHILLQELSAGLIPPSLPRDGIFAQRRGVSSWQWSTWRLWGTSND